MTNTEAFFRLGIPVTKNLSEIKKAYQTQVSHHHPEEDPEGFMRLHGAYKTACAYAKEADGGKGFFAEMPRKPEREGPAREETTYESLFSGMEEKLQADISPQIKAFSRKLLWLKLHWLPIGLKSWQRFFGSEAFLLCRESPDCMEGLLDLLERKIHTYPVFRFLLTQLWELNGWQISEGMEAQAKKTRACIKKLNEQYSHYLKWNSKTKAGKFVTRLLWYYQALPFYFKMPASVFLMPLMPEGSGASLWLIFAFYMLELCTYIRKNRRELGIFRWKLRWKNGVAYNTKPGDNGLVVIGTICAILVHLAVCAEFL